MKPGTVRLQLYFAAFSFAFGLHLAVNLFGQGVAVWVLATLCLVGLAYAAWGVFLSSGPVAGLSAIVGAVTLFALAVPLGKAMAGQHAGLAAAIGQSSVWPQMLVALFASRVLAQDSDVRLVHFRHNPAVPAQSQSFAAAVALGAFLTLVFYWAMPPALTSADPALKVLAAALRGATLLHAAILFLFFAILAAILDGFRLYWRDRAILAEVAQLDGTGDELSSLLARRQPEWASSRACLWLQEASSVAPSSAPRPSAAVTLDQIHLASRRYLRALIPLLPLLGFLGTVVGLTTALADLPQGLASGGAPDISASLGGLAIKFETTLLGLLSSMMAMAILGSLEKREAELKAACGSLAEKTLRLRMRTG